jgi:hypothetical protein
MSIESIFKDDREITALHKAMYEKEMSAEAVVRHFFRMGQLVDHYMKQGYKPVFRLSKGFGIVEEVDPFNLGGPKMAPMPECTCEQTDGKSCPVPLHQPAVPAIFSAKEHINCACWTTGRYQRVEGCPYHPYDL